MTIRAVCILLVASLALAPAGCRTGKRYSTGDGPTVAAPQAVAGETGGQAQTEPRRARARRPIEVLDVSYQEAMDIALKAALASFPNASIRQEPDSIAITRRSFWRGDASVRVKPKLVRNLGSEGGHGFTYEAQAFSVGGNPSMIPGYVASQFFSALTRYRKSHNIPTKRFVAYEMSRDQGTTNLVAKGIPVTHDEFARYLDEKADLDPFEGIWSDHSGRNVLGIIADASDPLYRYKAFVISSREINWQPGQIKIKFNRLKAGHPSISRFWGSDKRESGLTWDVGEETMVSLTSVQGAFRRGRIALVKTYPLERKVTTVGVGTGWAVTADGVFATNHHVIDGARNIWVGFREGNPKKAHIVAVDERLDLALVKIDKPDRSYRPLPLSQGRESNGASITVIGYPFAFELGDDPRVTEGIISAQKGDRKDYTRYQISAAIQPGNSGGPVLNDRAQVVGVVVSRIDPRVADNVNFAVKIPYLKLLLESAGIEPATGRSDGTRSPKELFEIFGASVLPIWTRN